MNRGSSGEVLLIRGRRSFLLVSRAGARFGLCIETPEEEVCQGVDKDDLVVVSAPEGGDLEPALMLLDLVRRFHLPLIVLPRDHPGSARLRYVVSAGPEIVTSCSIRRGTHPEQSLICSGDDLAGITIRGKAGEISLPPLPDGTSVRRMKYGITTEFS